MITGRIELDCQRCRRYEQEISDLREKMKRAQELYESSRVVAENRRLEIEKLKRENT